MDIGEFRSLCSHVGFDDDASAALRATYDVLRPHLPAIVDDFYAGIAANPSAMRVITGGTEQVERLKNTLIRWLDSVLLGPQDEIYLQVHARIGNVHVRIGLPQELMFTAMGRIRARLVEVMQTDLVEPLRTRASVALHQALDLELAIMLESYRLHAESRMRAAERLATIGQLSASIGHELRNPLGIIGSSILLVQRKLERLAVADADLTKHIDRIQRQVNVCEKTITDLLELARSRPLRRQRVRVAELLAQAVIDRDFGTTLVQGDFEADLEVSVDPGQLNQVLGNLLLNASQAMRGGGRVIVRGARGAGGVAITVQDEGPGVPAGDRVRIFEALFTTKAKGTGLGLALCRRIVEAHGGEIALEPAQRGASFRIWLPDDSPNDG